MSDGSDIDVEAVIANAAKDFPALYNLCTGYFDQAWSHRFSGWHEAATAFVGEATPFARHGVIRDIDTLIRSDLDESQLGLALYPGLECWLVPNAVGLSPREWLRELRAALRPI